MKKLIKLTSLGLVLTLSLTACSEKPKEVSENTNEVVENEEVVSDNGKDKTKDDLKNEEEAKEEENQSKINQKLAKLYNDVLDDINSYEFSDVEDGKYTYSYALVKTDESDYPNLLVAQDTDFGLSYLKFFTANDDYTDVLYDDEIISVGVASAGGFRGFIAQNADYDALNYTTFMSGTGEGQEEKITTSVEDGDLKLEREVIWEGRIDNKAQDESYEIEFSEIEDRDKISDLSAIKDGEYVKSLEEENDEKEKASEENKEVPSASQKEGESLESKIQAEKNLGNMVATGSVRVFSHAELLDYQQVNPKAIPDTGINYAILLLDSPIDVTVQSGAGDGPFTRNVDMIGLPEDMMNYDGQYITISFGTNDGHWQSDASLPMDAPRMHQVKVLE